MAARADQGDVDAWAGLDPIMASAELEDGAGLFYRNPAANSWGILNVREEFAEQNPDIVRRVLAVLREGAQMGGRKPARNSPPCSNA